MPKGRSMTTTDWQPCEQRCLPGSPSLGCPIHSGRPANALPAIERIEAMALRPGDTIVVTLTEGTTLDREQHAGLVQALAAQFPGHQILVAAGFTLDVVRPDDEEASHTEDQHDPNVGPQGTSRGA